MKQYKVQYNIQFLDKLLKEKIKEAKISPYAEIIYNNALYNAANINHLKPAMGKIRLIDSNNDKNYDVVIVEEFRNVFTTSTITPPVVLFYTYYSILR